MCTDIKLSDEDIYLELDKQSGAEGDHPPSYLFSIKKTKDNVTVGKCSFRVGDSDNRHIKYGGNIGYEIDEPFRGNKYSLKACKLLLALARSYNMKSVLITCAPENKASRRICALLGARLITILDLPEDDYNYIKHGTKQHCVYKLDCTK